jgi:predicted nuclease of predicted toxin-antitoxin system
LRWLADENFPLASVKQLRKAGVELSAIAEDQPGLVDRAVLAWAHEDHRALLTFDRDFGELLFQEGLPPPAAVVYLRFIPISPEEPAEVVLALLRSGVELEGQFVVLDRDSFRSRPLSMV